MIRFDKLQDAEEIIPGFVRGWLRDRKIVVYKLLSNEDYVVDRWIEVGRETLLSWKVSTPYCAIHDLSAGGVELTPYARLATTTAIKRLPLLPMYSANVLSQSPTNRLLQLFVSFNLGTKHPTLKRQIVFSLEDGVTWLLHQIDNKI